MTNYNHLVLLDLEIYMIHSSGYNPVKNIQNFWERYSLSKIHEYIVATSQPEYISNEDKCSHELVTFSVELLRVLIAYFMLHKTEMGLDKVSIRIPQKQHELETFKRIYDFFQRASPYNTNL